MRTKTLLIAAAALAAMVISSEAQTPVYSANVVGYTQQILPGGFTPIVNTVLNADGTNGAEHVLSSLQPGDTLYVWNGGGYTVSTYTGEGDPNNWQDGFTSDQVSIPVLPVGVGFFYQNNSGNSETNVFAGTVVFSNNVVLPGGFTLTGSTPPVTDTGEGTNLALPLQPGDTLFVWNGGGYNVTTYTGEGDPNNWQDGFTSDQVSAPVIPVGSSFFYQNNSGGNEPWAQTNVVLH